MGTGAEPAKARAGARAESRPNPAGAAAGIERGYTEQQRAGDRRSLARKNVWGGDLVAKLGRSTVSFAAAGGLALVALAAFLILDLAGGSIDPSSLPVIQIGQSGSAGSQSLGQTTETGQGQAGSTSPTAASDSATTLGIQTNGGSTTTSTAGTATGSTLREVVNGGVHTGSTTGTGAGTGNSTNSGGSRGTASTNTTGGR